MSDESGVERSLVDPVAVTCGVAARVTDPGRVAPSSTIATGGRDMEGADRLNGNGGDTGKPNEPPNASEWKKEPTYSAIAGRLESWTNF